ncbi:TPA: hypothetical protein ACOLXW_004326 [Vibrio parahaemolyticus]
MKNKIIELLSKIVDVDYPMLTGKLFFILTFLAALVTGYGGVTELFAGDAKLGVLGIISCVVYFLALLGMLKKVHELYIGSYLVNTMVIAGATASNNPTYSNVMDKNSWHAAVEMNFNCLVYPLIISFWFFVFLFVIGMGSALILTFTKE